MAKTTLTCTCPRIKLGSERTENRNWNPSCPKHGTGSEWYRSEAQVTQRQIADTRLRVLQTLARLRRQDRIGLAEAQEIITACTGRS